MGEGARVPIAGASKLEVPGLTDQIGFKLRLVQGHVWADLVATLEPFGLRPHHYAALVIISERDGCKQQDIGQVLGLYRSNLVALVEELCGRALVSRAAKPGDRRSYALSLTLAGVTLLDQAKIAHRGHQARVAQALGPHDSSLFSAMLDSLLASDLARAPQS